MNHHFAGPVGSFTGRTNHARHDHHETAARLARAGGRVGLGALGVAAPAQAESCFWAEFGQGGSKRCYNSNVRDFAGHTFPNGEPLRDASSYQNLNWTWNEVVHNYNEPDGPPVRHPARRRP